MVSWAGSGMRSASSRCTAGFGLCVGRDRQDEREETLVSAPIPGFELSVDDGLRVTDWMMWVFPASGLDRQLNRQICERCGLKISASEIRNGSPSAGHEADLAMSVRDLGLPFGAISGLEHNNIRYIVDLLRRSPEDLATIPGVSRDTVRLIEQRLEQFDLTLGSLPGNAPSAEGAHAEEAGAASGPPAPSRTSKRSGSRPIALNWEEAEVVLRWYTYVPPHFRTERDRRIAGGLADFLDVPLTMFEDLPADEHGREDEEEATFDLVDSDDELPALPGEIVSPLPEGADELDPMRLLAEARAETGDEIEVDVDAEEYDMLVGSEMQLVDAREDDEDDDDEDDDEDSEEIVFELDEDLARDLGIEGSPLDAEADEPKDPTDIDPIWTPDDPDAWKSGDELDPDFWKENDENDELPW